MEGQVARPEKKVGKREERPLAQRVSLRGAGGGARNRLQGKVEGSYLASAG